MTIKKQLQNKDNYKQKPMTKSGNYERHYILRMT